VSTTKHSALSGPQQNASFVDALAELATPLLAEYGGTVKEVDGVMTALLALAAKEMTTRAPRHHSRGRCLLDAPRGGGRFVRHRFCQRPW
jgi:hypothetical protein